MVRRYKHGDHASIAKTQELDLLKVPSLKEAYNRGIIVGENRNLSIIELKNRIIGHMAKEIKELDMRDKVINEAIRYYRRSGGQDIANRPRYRQKTKRVH
jgi:hypothetical protein